MKERRSVDVRGSHRREPQGLQEILAQSRWIFGRSVRAAYSALLEASLDRHDDVAFDLDHLALRLLGDATAPGLLVPQIAAIAHHQGGIAARAPGRTSSGPPGAHDEPDAAPVQAPLDLRQALQHEGVVARRLASG